VLVRLTRTIPTLDRTTLYHALQAEIELFRDLQGRVWPRLGIAVDETQGRAIQDAIQRGWTAGGTQSAGSDDEFAATLRLD